MFKNKRAISFLLISILLLALAAPYASAITYKNTSYWTADFYDIGTIKCGEVRYSVSSNPGSAPVLLNYAYVYAAPGYKVHYKTNIYSSGRYIYTNVYFQNLTTGQIVYRGSTTRIA